MKPFILVSLFIISFVIFSCKNNSSHKTPKLKLLWETDTIFKTSESCLYDPKHHVIYVSNVNNAPRTKDNNGFISLLHTDGGVIKLKWATGMSAPKGMGYFNEVLYVTDIDAVLEIDAHTGEIIDKHVLEGALMLNDIAIDALGTVYVSAMDTHKIYKLIDGDFILWKDHLNSPNGLNVLGNNLLVASAGDGTLKAFDITTKKEVKHLASNLGRADGVVSLKSGNHLVSDWRGEIFHIGDSITSLYNTVKNDKLQSADIGNIPNKNIILVPTFFGNSVKAFKLTE